MAYWTKDTGAQSSYADVLKSRNNKTLTKGLRIPKVSSVWKTLPEDIFCNVLESAIEPKDGTAISLIDPVRLDTARKLCLISKSTANWIEPLLYKSVALVTLSQVYSFCYALETKSREFLSRHVRALYILYRHPSDYRWSSRCLPTICFPLIFDTLKGLEKLALRGHWCRQFYNMQPVPPSSIIDLTLIDPPYNFERLYEHQLSLRSLHIIDPDYESTSISGTFRDLQEPSPQSSMLSKKLNAIPRICLDFTYTTCHAPGQFVDVLAITLRGVERSHTVQGSNATVDMVTRSMVFYEQHRGPESPPYSSIFKDDDQNDTRSLWVKTSPFIKADYDPSATLYGPRGSWMQSRPNMEANKRTWEGVAARYEENGPKNRPACWESPLSEHSESLRFQRLPRLERMKLAIHYNELHWDRIARWCESET